MKSYTVYLFPIEEFVEYAVKSVDGLTFPDLANSIKLFKSRIFPSSTADEDDRSQLIVGLLELEKKISVLKNKKKFRHVQQLPDLVDSAITYLVYELGIEVVQWSRRTQLVNFLNDIHKYISERGREFRTTNLHFADRYKRLGAPDGSTEQEIETHELQEMWVGILTALPSMSVKVKMIIYSVLNYHIVYLLII
jgi:hypothetical protein